MKRKAFAVGGMVWKVATRFVADECPLRAAAIAYYTIFAMPPFLALLAFMASEFLSPGQLRALIMEQVRSRATATGATDCSPRQLSACQPCANR